MQTSMRQAAFLWKKIHHAHCTCVIISNCLTKFIQQGDGEQSDENI